jgi:cytochrome c5
MNQGVKLLFTSGLSLLLLAFFSIELTTNASRLDGGLVLVLGEERTSAQTNRLRKNSLSLWERAGVRDEVSEGSRKVRRSGFISSYAKPLTLTLSQREREIVSPFEGQQTKAQSKRSSTLVVDLFRTNCARCHGADGRGDTPLGHTYNAPEFTDAEWWRKHADITSTVRLISIVSHGKGGMPAFGKKLKPSEIKLLVNYVRRFRKS